MASPTSDRPIVPIPASDPLLVDCLRAGLEAYVRGEYADAAQRFLDASAIAQHRPEHMAWRLVGVVLDSAIAGLTLPTDRAMPPAGDEVRA
jgi:hypothetical protein